MIGNRIKLLLLGAVSLGAAWLALFFVAHSGGASPVPVASTIGALILALLAMTSAYFLFVRPARLARGHKTRRLHESHHIDPLTDTLNERGITIKLLEHMALSDRYGNPLAVALAGVDHFTRVNEEFGREAGDRALRTVADVLSEALRMPDHVGRFGEDRFLILLPETTMRGARQIGERVCQAVAQAEIEVDRRRALSLTVSIGITIFRQGDDLEQLLARVNRVLEQAKIQGRNRVITDLAA